VRQEERNIQNLENLFFSPGSGQSLRRGGMNKLVGDGRGEEMVEFALEG